LRSGRTPHVFASTFFVPPSRFFPSVLCNPNVVWDYSSNVGHRPRVWPGVQALQTLGLSPPTSPAALLPSIDGELRQKLAPLVPRVVTCESRSAFLLREGRVEQSSIFKHRACDVE
jgi:hypothetical protein